MRNLGSKPLNKGGWQWRGKRFWSRTFPGEEIEDGKGATIRINPTVIRDLAWLQRRGRDSNSRSPEGLNGFQVRRLW